MDFLHALVQFRFMQFALGACILASIGCGAVGVYVVVKRVGFLAGGIAHAVLGGMGVAYFFGLSPFAGAVATALLAAVLIGWVKLRWSQEEDVLIGALWSVGMAIGIIFISRVPGYTANLMSYLFGNILLVSGRDLGLMAALDVIVVASVFMFYKPFLAISCDEEFARARGINVEFFYIVMLCLVALTVVLLIRIVGLVLVIALLVLPAACATLLAGSMTRTLVIAVALCVFVTVTGLAASYAPDLPSGATMVVVAGLVYLAVAAGRALTGRGGRP